MKPVFAFQAFGQLNGRQRISDFMRDAARDVGPCGGPLRAHKVGDVVERDDIALVGAACRGAGDADAEQPVETAARQRDLGRRQARQAGARLCESFSDFRQDGIDRLTDDRGRALPAGGISRSADGLSTVISPLAPTPTTATGTPDRTASVKRRLSSMRLLAAMSLLCCSRSSEVILLNVSPRWARSPSDFRTAT